MNELIALRADFNNIINYLLSINSEKKKIH